MKGKEVEWVCRALEQAIDRSRRRRIR